MPKVKPLIPTELVLEKLDVLAEDIQLIPEQVSMILGISERQLKEDRKEGNKPYSVRQGGSVRYRVGDVRAYLKEQTVFKNSGEAFAEKLNKENDLIGFLSNGKLDDSWPFSIIKHKPVDFFESLSIEMDPEEDYCAWLTLKEYLEKRLAFAHEERAEWEAQILRESLLGHEEHPNKLINL